MNSRRNEILFYRILCFFLAILTIVNAFFCHFKKAGVSNGEQRLSKKPEAHEEGRKGKRYSQNPQTVIVFPILIPLHEQQGQYLHIHEQSHHESHDQVKGYIE